MRGLRDLRSILPYAQRDISFDFSVCPLQRIFQVQQQRLSILLFHLYAEGLCCVSSIQVKVLAKDQVRTTVQQKSRNNTPDIIEYKHLVYQNTRPFKRDFRGYLYIQVAFHTNFTSLKFQVCIPNKFTKCAKTYRHIVSETV